MTQQNQPELLDRTPPHDLDAERAVLGCMILSGDACDEVIMLLREEDFYADAHQKLFRHLSAMHADGKRVDALLLKKRLQREGDLEAIGGMAYLAEVATSVPYAAHATHYAKIVREKAIERGLMHAGIEVLRDSYDVTTTPEQKLAKAEQLIFAVRDDRADEKVRSIGELLIEAMDLIDARRAGTHSGQPTGLIDLDKATSGLHDSELTILASRPSMGKSALATTIAKYVAVESEVPVLFISLEMSALELADRLLCSMARVPMNTLRSGFLSDTQRPELVKASNVLGRSRLAIDDTPSRSVAEIAAAARRMKRKGGLGLVVVDYMQLIRPENSRDPRQEQVAKMARGLKLLAREVKVPVLCLAQLNREVEDRTKHRPRLSDLRESGAIEQDADVVLLLHREEMYRSPEDKSESTEGIANLIIAKQRNGPCCDVRLAWFGKYTRFENLDARRGF